MLPGFWFSFAFLALLRLTRGCTTLAATVSVLLSLLVLRPLPLDTSVLRP